MKNKVLAWISTAFAMLFLQGCQVLSSHPIEMTPVALPPDPHHHPIDVHSGKAHVDLCNKSFKVVKTSLPSNPVRIGNITSNQGNTWKAFTACIPMLENPTLCHDKLFVEGTQFSQVYELQTTCFLGWRPFSSLVWLTDDILVFDQWANPHFGHHYAVDMRQGKLVIASPFPDQFTLDQQKSK